MSYSYGLWPIAAYGLSLIAHGLWPTGHALHSLVVSVCRAADAQPIVIEETTAAAFEALLHFVYSDALVVDDELLVDVLRHGHVCSHVYTYVSDLVPRRCAVVRVSGRTVDNLSPHCSLTVGFDCGNDR